MLKYSGRENCFLGKLQVAEQKDIACRWARKHAGYDSWPFSDLVSKARLSTWKLYADIIVLAEIVQIAWVSVFEVWKY